MEVHQKNAEPDYRRLKTMVKRCLEKNVRSRNFDARNGRIEFGALVKNQREHRRVQRGPGDCWQWQASGQCTKGDNCSFRYDEDKRAKPKSQPAPSPEPLTQQDGQIQRERKVLEAAPLQHLELRIRYRHRQEERRRKDIQTKTSRCATHGLNYHKVHLNKMALLKPKSENTSCQDSSGCRMEQETCDQGSLRQGGPLALGPLRHPNTGVAILKQTEKSSK